MKFLYVFGGLILGVGVSVSLAQSGPTVTPPVGYSSCVVTSWTPPNFSGKCNRVVQQAAPGNATYSMNAGGNIYAYAQQGLAQGGPCTMAGPNRDLCLGAAGCEWYSPQGTIGGREITQRERDSQSYCYDKCARLRGAACSSAAGCTSITTFNPILVRIVGSGEGLENVPRTLDACVRSSSPAARMGQQTRFLQAR